MELTKSKISEKFEEETKDKFDLLIRVGLIILIILSITILIFSFIRP